MSVGPKSLAPTSSSIGLPIAEATIPVARDLVERLAGADDPELGVEDDEDPAERLEDRLQRPETGAFLDVEIGIAGLSIARIIRRGDRAKPPLVQLHQGFARARDLPDGPNTL